MDQVQLQVHSQPTQTGSASFSNEEHPSLPRICAATREEITARSAGGPPITRKPRNRGGKGTGLGEESGRTGAQEEGPGAVPDALGGGKQVPKGTGPTPPGSGSSLTRSLACRTGHDSAWRESPEDTSGGPPPLSHGSRAVAQRKPNRPTSVKTPGARSRSGR